MSADHTITFFTSGPYDCARCSCTWWARANHTDADRGPKLATAVTMHLNSSRYMLSNVKPRSLVVHANGHRHG